MSEAARQLEHPSPRCDMCDEPVTIAPNGRPRKYCSGRCRTRAARLREAVRWLKHVDDMRVQLEDESRIDWSDEAHRVA